MTTFWFVLLLTIARCLNFNKVDRYSAAEKEKISVPMPSLINDYNRNMGGVDQVDENIGNYHIASRDKKCFFFR